MDGGVDSFQAVTGNSRRVEVSPGQVDAYLAVAWRMADDRVDLVTAFAQRPDESATDESAGAGHGDLHLQVLLRTASERATEGVDRSVGLVCVEVALLVEVVHPIPGSVEIDVRDHLAWVSACREFDLLAAAHAAHVVARLHAPHDSSRTAHGRTPATGSVVGTAGGLAAMFTLTR